MYAGSERIEQFTDKGNWERILYVHEDVMGNTWYYTKANGQSFAELTYDAWGMPESPNKLLNNDHGNYVFATFTGRIYDTTLDIYFAEARFYDANNRTWLAMDPIKDGLNWYQYCYSNPTTYWDPLGLEGAVGTLNHRVWNIARSNFNKMSCQEEKKQKEENGDTGKSIVSEYNLRILKLVVNSPMGFSVWSSGIERYMALYYANGGLLGLDRWSTGIAWYTAFFEANGGNIDVIKKEFEREYYQNIYKQLTKEQKIFLSTIAGESINKGEVGWQIVANIIMNRIGVKDWSQYSTVTEIIEHSSFDAYTGQTKEYKKAWDYFNGNESSDNAELYKELMITTLPIYEGIASDITNGGELYYSPKSMAPKGSIPSWNFNELDQIHIPDMDENSFKVYKYKEP